jgi:hypothetical protein
MVLGWLVEQVWNATQAKLMSRLVTAYENPL